jgi:hypothetical protein
MAANAIADAIRKSEITAKEESAHGSAPENNP